MDEEALTQSATETVVDNFLEHYGKKGMRWGVRRAYDIKVSNRAARNRRVGEGKGSKTDKVVTALTLSGHDLARGHFRAREAALNKAVRQEQHIKRIRAGKATTLDILQEVGGISMLNLRDLHKVKREVREARKAA